MGILSIFSAKDLILTILGLLEPETTVCRPPLAGVREQFPGKKRLESVLRRVK